MRILAVIDRYPPAHTGGYELACYGTLGALGARGQEITVLTTEVEGEPSSERVLRGLHEPSKIHDLLALARARFADERLLRSVVEKTRPDIVSVWRLSLAFPSLHRVLGSLPCPVVYNLHDVWIPAHLSHDAEMARVWRQPGRGLVRGLAKSGVRAGLSALHPGWLEPLRTTELPLQNVVFCSAFQNARHVEAGLPLGRSTVIPNGLDPELFRADPLPDSPARLSLLFSGRLVEEKGPWRALEVVALLRKAGIDAHLSIAGLPAWPFEFGERLRERAAAPDLAGAVRFLGAVPWRELPAVYAAHVALLFPSEHLEGLPMVVLEAMACGRPVVGSVPGGTAELLEDGVTGFVCPSRDAAAMVDRCTRLLREPGLARRMGATARQRFEDRYTLGRVAEMTERFYDDTLRQVASARRRGPGVEATARPVGGP